MGRGGGTDVLVCTPVYRAGSYVLDRFLSNQREIQERFPACALVLATVEDVEDPFKIAGT